MSEQKNNQLFNEFPQITPETWRTKIVTDLKGADFDKKLVWKTREGFAVQPFYTEEDIENLNHLDCNPGEYPFVRGNKKTDNDWLVAQNICACDVEQANKKALDVLNKGINSLYFEFHTDKKVEASDIEKLLNNVCIEAVEINFLGVKGVLEFTDAFLSVLAKNNVDPNNFNGSINYDPIGCFTLKGRFCSSQEDAMSKCKSIIEKTRKFESLKAITVSGIHFNNAGATTIQELAFSLAAGSEYIAQMCAQGLTAEEANKKLKFHFGIGGNYFFEIAKFRAARFLWAQIMQQYGASKEGSKMYIHAQTSQWNKTVYDPHTNLLRTTTEAMSAAIGGVESMVIDPYNTVFENSNEISERIARNQQTILKEESYFDKIVDPAAGSYYIENLTQKIAENAWKLFVEIENEGGYLAAFRKEFVQNILNNEAKSRRLAVANRQENLLGTNQFPNFTEHKNEIEAAIMLPCDETKTDAEVKGIVRYRGAQDFEQLRFSTDQYSKTNKRPLAFMLTYGSIAFSNARSQFSQNFFAIAGFDVKDNPNFATIEEGVNAAISAKADIIVLCSSDEEYENIAPQALQLIGSKAITVVAGFPKNIVDELKSKGIKHFIHVHSNVLETLQGFQKEIGMQ